MNSVIQLYLLKNLNLKRCIYFISCYHGKLKYKHVKQVVHSSQLETPTELQKRIFSQFLFIFVPTMHLIIHILMLLSWLCSLTNSINCISCDSKSDSRCLDPFDTQSMVGIMLVDCDQWNPSGGFFKFCEKKKEVVGNVEVIIRGCSTETEWNEKDIYKMQDGKMSCIWREGKENCLCNTDMCNTGERKRVELMMLFVLAGILRIV